MTLRHWQMEKVSGSAEPLLSTTGNKGLNRSSGATINFDSTALFGKFSVEGKYFFDTDAAGSLADNEFTIGFWFRVPTEDSTRYIFQLGLHNTDVSTNGHTCVGLFYGYGSNKLFFTTGYKNADGGYVELGSASHNTWYHCYISRTNAGSNSTLQVKITQTDGTVIHDESEVYTKADFSIDESGTGQYSYFNGHPAGGSLSLGSGKIEDFILKNGSVLSYASIYNSSAEVFQSDEPQVSVSTGAGSATLSGSNFTGTKTYSFYDTDATTLLQSGASTSYNSYASSSVAYTALVTDTNNNRVISTFFVSQGGNNMAITQITSTAQTLPGGNLQSYNLLGTMLGGLGISKTGGTFATLPVQVSATHAPGAGVLTMSYASHSSTVIQALNRVAALAAAANPGGSDYDFQFNDSESFAGRAQFTFVAPNAANTTQLIKVQTTGGFSVFNPSTEGQTINLGAAGTLSGASAADFNSLRVHGTVSGGAGTFLSLTGTGAATFGSLGAAGAISGGAITALSLTGAGAATFNSLGAAGAISGGAITALSLTGAGAATFNSLGAAGAISGGAVTALSLTASGAGTFGSLGAAGAISGGAITALSLTANGQVDGATLSASSLVRGSLTGASVSASFIHAGNHLAFNGTNFQGVAKTFKLNVSGGILRLVQTD